MDNITTEWKEIPATPFPWHRLIFGVYSIGIAFMLIRLLTAIKEIQKIKQYGKHTWVDGKLCILSGQVKSPFSFFNTIYFPAHHTFGEEELREVIAHEMAHVDGKHSWDILFMELGCILLWPSPLIYLYRKALKDVHEYVADAAVLKDTPWEDYARLLLSQQQGQLQNILSNQLMYSQLKKRLVMMNKERSSVISRYKYLGVVPLILIAIVLFSFREKMNEGAWLSSTNELSQPERILTLKIDKDKKIYFQLAEISKNDIEAVLRNQMAITNDTLLMVHVENSFKVEEMADIDAIGQRLKIRTVFHTDTVYHIHKDGLRMYSDLPNIPFQYSADTLPETYVIALRLTEPAGHDRNDLMPGNHSSIPENRNLDYELGLPIFPGCDEVVISERGDCGMRKLGEYINQHLVYPSGLKTAGKEGRVLVKFVVSADGYVEDVEIRESLHPDADQAVLDLVNGMNANAGRWRPARKEGKSYDAEMILPVKFALDHKVDNETPVQYAEELPRFPGCEEIANQEERSSCATQKLYEFIYTNIRYPAEDRTNNVQGHCIVQFVIGANGDIYDINVRRAPSESIKAEVIRLMELMADMPDKWIPAKDKGLPVAMQFTLPVKFQLQDDEVQNPKATASASVDPLSIPVEVVPNPASETISVKVLEGTQAIHIFNSSGTLVLSRKINAGSVTKELFEVSGLVAGRYTVQVITSKGTANGSFVLIK
jgi:TonB family protein